MKGYTIYWDKNHKHCHGKVMDEKTGKIISVSGRFTIEDQCDKECIKIRNAINEGLYRADAKMPLKELCLMYFDQYADPELKNLRKSTSTTTKRLVNKHIMNSSLAKLPLHAINNAAITRFKNDLVRNTHPLYRCVY